MRFSAVSGHKVVSTTSATTVGAVRDLVVDPASRQVVALHLKKTDDGDVLPWPSLTAVGPDAVTVPGPEVLTAAEGRVAELLGKEHRLLGKRLLSDGGDELGKVEDVDFDPSSGALLTLLTSAGELAADRLVGVGRYAVVVRR